MEQQTKEENKKHDKQKTYYNKILVGARTRDRNKNTRDEKMINSRLNGSNLAILISSTSI